MAQGSKYKVAFRRRREGKTDYRARIKLVDLSKSRLVVRISNANIIVQVINLGKNGDETVVSAHSKELQKLGWLGGTSNTGSAYLTAYLCAKKALNKDIKEVIFDIGLKPSIKGSKVFASLKGASDAGLQIPHGESVLPTEDRIFGENIVDYFKSLDDSKAKKQFSQYFQKGLDINDLPNHFEKIKNKIDEV